MSSVVRIWWLVLPSMGSHFVVSTFSFPSLGSIFGSIFGGSSVGSYFLEVNTPRNVEMLPHTTECGQTQKGSKFRVYSFTFPIPVFTFRVLFEYGFQ